MTAPALPREVWAYTSSILSCKAPYFFTSEETARTNHRDEALYFYERRVSPIGRYVLADAIADWLESRSEGVAAEPLRKLADEIRRGAMR